MIIDGGNSHFEDTRRRINTLGNHGIHFLGTGISGGEQGALTGPSIMPSGDRPAYELVSKYLNAIAAFDDRGQPCCVYVGTQGSGHYVKMIHNGMEYAEMQLLAECYFILKLQGLENEQIADVMTPWKTELDSYLLTITIDILKKKNGDRYVLDEILDKAGNKGTGSWATISAEHLGTPSTHILRMSEWQPAKRIHENS